MTQPTTHITTSGGLISAAFIDNIREPRTRQLGTEPESFAMPGRPPTPSRKALNDDIAAAWELMLERWDAIHDEIRMFDVSQVRNRWLLPLFQVLDFDPVYVRGDVVLDEAGKLRYPLSHRGWPAPSETEGARDGAPALGVFGYDGMLFAEHQTPLLNGRDPCGERSRTMRNSDLLHAIRDLTLIEREGVLQRISYADLGVEELGSIYASLLDFTLRVTTEAEDVNGREIPPYTFFLDPRGSERKTTGSYYTHDSLVRELIKSALLPVARDRLAEAGLPIIAEDEIGEATAGLLEDYIDLTDAQREAGEEALLSLKICDPAAGSGHFLVKANNALGAELARVRTGDEYPTEAEIQAAKRDVLARSIYAVDLNPMAVELCKVSLWINASVRDRPLSFLDHHIKCGSSLIGATPELLAEGVPYEAFDHTLEGNDRERAKEIRKRNRQERRDMEEGGGFQPSLLRVTVFDPEFKALWQRIAQRTRYRVQLDTEALIEACADAVRLITIQPIQVRTTRGRVDHIRDRGAFETTLLGEGAVTVEREYEIPNVTAWLAEETNLTRRTLRVILERAGNLGEVFNNPAEYIQRAAEAINRAKRHFLVDGVQYVELDDAYEMSLFENLEGYEDSLVPIERSIYDHVIADSTVERDFAQALDEVKLFVKLPDWFLVPTPVGEYNPDWAIVFTVQDAFGEAREKLYLVRETKGSLDEDELRGMEEMKIDCARRHFEATAVDYGVVTGVEELRGRR